MPPSRPAAAAAYPQAASQNRPLNDAADDPDDEFYTPRQTIEDELRRYKPHFAGKRVLCNCDDPAESEFFKFFAEKFGEWQLAKLVGTHYAQSRLFPKAGRAHYKVITPESGGRRTPLKGNGDFRSPECLKLLDEANIVVTNPPFSLFREFVAELTARRKAFLIIGNINAMTYKEFFPLIRDNKVWLGYSPRCKEKFNRPDGNSKSVSACWYTNIPHPRRNDIIRLGTKYSEDKYPKYDNYDAIEVGKTNDIPAGYDDKMGVPITYLEKHNPEQFEIVGLCRYLLQESGSKDGRFKVNGREKYGRVIIKRKGDAK